MKDKLSTLEIIMKDEDVCSQEIMVKSLKCLMTGRIISRLSLFTLNRFYKTIFTSLGHWHDCVRSWLESLVKGIKGDGH